MHVSSCFVLETMINVGLCCYVKESSWVLSVEFLVENNNIGDIGMSVKVQEECVAWIFGNGCVHVARCTHRTRILELEDSGQISVDSET